MRASEKAAGEARKRGAAVVRREKRAEKIAKVKGAVKSALGKAKEAAKSVARKAIDEPARKYAEKRGVVPSKSGKSSLGSGTGIQSVAYKQRTPEGRREVRARVAADIKGRIKKKIAQAQVGAYSAARKAGQAASDVAGRAKQSAKNLAARTGRAVSGAASAAKAGAKSAVGKAARKVASGAGRVASRLGEEVDVYDIVLSYLIDEGYADTIEQAECIMVNMSEEWREEILEGGYNDLFRGQKKKRGAKSERWGSDREGNPTGKYSDMQYQKRQAQRERDADEQRRRDRGAMSRGTWDRD
jgi:hypothetical protein